MFAIYNNGSVSFRSTADNLYEVKNTDAVFKPSLKPDDDTLFQDYLKREQKDTSYNQSAINTYKEIANIDTSEVIYHVKDIMTRNCISIEENSSLLDVYNLLKENSVSQIPIVSSENKIMGLINKKMILNLLIEDIDNSKYILNKKLSDLYFSDLITVDPISDIRRVAKVMIDFKLDAIPVVNEEGVLVGIVSKTDIINAISNIPKLQLWS